MKYFSYYSHIRCKFKIMDSSRTVISLILGNNDLRVCNRCKLAELGRPRGLHFGIQMLNPPSTNALLDD